MNHAFHFVEKTNPMSSRLTSNAKLNSLCIFISGFIFMVLMANALEVAAQILLQAPQAPESNPKVARRIQLSLKQAVDFALSPEGNTRIQLAREQIRLARSRSGQARAALLPNIDSSLSYQNRTVNLAAVGIRLDVPIPGFRVPTRVGPFDTYDTRATATQNILDISSIRRFQASRSGVMAAEFENDSAQDQVAGQVAKWYLAAVRADADLDATKANVVLSEALLRLATDQKAAGTGTGIDVTRARVQLANERQRLLVSENERERAHLQLLRALGSDLDTKLELTDKLTLMEKETLTTEQAIGAALQTRADLRAQERREENARLTYSATKLERLPALVGFADYGTIGSVVSNTLPTRTYGASVRLPLFDGGRRDARRAEARSQLELERIRTRDLRQQIELEVRLALENLQSADEQVAVAKEGLELAHNELAQARRRYQSGVASSLEITDAQTRLERARDNQITAFYNYNLARLDLGLAIGNVRQFVR